MVALLLTGCGKRVNEAKQVKTDERMEAISEQEIMEYLERLLGSYIKTSDIETDEQVNEVLDEIKSTSTDIIRELKKDYGKDIHAVNDLIDLSEVLIKLGKVTEDNIYLIKDYNEEITYHIYNISTEYLDGKIPDNYAKVLGVDNLYDLD